MSVLQAERLTELTVICGMDLLLAMACQTLVVLVQADARVLKEPTQLMVVGELADNTVNFPVRVRTVSVDHWPGHFDRQEHVKKRFGDVSLSMPFPQCDVYRHTMAA